MTKNTTSEITESYASLTKHPEGSLKEMFAISFPLMLSILSGNLMLFLDRLILANYSIEAMNAAAASGMACMVFHYGAIGIASIGEVFVGQQNGARKYHLAAQPAWQMIWFSLMSSIVFFGAAFFLGPVVLADYYYQEHGLPYFQWLLYFGPFFAMQAAVSGFFIGIGRVKLVTAATIIGNIANVVLDLIFVFGIKGIIPEMGTKGAALATGLSQVTIIAILLFPYFAKEIREKYQTFDWKFRWGLFKRCLRIGVPSATGHMIEITAWALMIRMLVEVSETHLTVMAIGQSFYSVIAFGMEGLQKGVTTITANLIGAKKWVKVNRAWWSAVKMLFILAAVFTIPMIVYPEPMLNEFLSTIDSPVEAAQLKELMKVVCVFIWIYFILDGLTWISAGVLTAAGDTLFVMIMNGVSGWLFALLPIYYFVVKRSGSPEEAWAIVCIYGMMNAACFYARYRMGKWKTVSSLV